MQCPTQSLLQDLEKFYAFYEQSMKSQQITSSNTRKRNKSSRMAPHRIMAVLLMFHLSGYRDFRSFYEIMIQGYLKKMFPHSLSYSWFIRIKSRYLHAMFCYLTSKMQPSHEISYIDSTCLKACHIKRASSHKTFKGIAEKGHTSVGWFYGFKLHLVIDAYGNIVDFCVSKGNKHDTYGLDKLTKNIKGLLFGDKGYISQKKAKQLEDKGIKLITKPRKNMKPKSLSKEEKSLLRSRGVIETVIGQLKDMHHVENTKVRSMHGWMMNILAALTAYQIRAFKPSIKPVLHSNTALIRI